jgi:hypothetical protein
MPPSSSETDLVLTTNNAQAEILLIDGRFRVLARGTSPLQFRVEPGLYLVKVKVGDEEVEQLFTVPADTPTLSQHLDAPLFESPIPLGATSTKHEYHIAYVGELCSASFPLIARGTGAEILVSLRDPSDAPRRVTGKDATDDDHARYRASFAGLSLLDAAGNALVDLSAEGRIDVAAGYLAARISVPPGSYALAHERLGTRLCISLPAAAGWSHQIFVRLNAQAQTPFDAVPDLLDASVLIERPNTGFDPNRTDLHLVETVRRGFLDGRNHLGIAAHAAIERGIDNPMLGLYGAHLLLREATFDVAAFGGVVDRLVQQLGPDFPDVLALRWVRANKTADSAAMSGLASELAQLAGPPLLARSWDLMVELAKAADLPAAPLPALKVAPNLLAGSVFVSWRQVELAPQRAATGLQAARPAPDVAVVAGTVLDGVVAPAGSPAGKGTWMDLAKVAAGPLLAAMRRYGSLLRSRQKSAQDTARDLAATISEIRNVEQAAAALRVLAQSYPWNTLIPTLRKEAKWTQYLTGLQRDLLSILRDAAGDRDALEGVTPAFVQRLLDSHRIPLSTLVQALSDLELGGWLQAKAGAAVREAIRQYQTTKALRAASPASSATPTSPVKSSAADATTPAGRK